MNSRRLVPCFLAVLPVSPLAMQKRAYRKAQRRMTPEQRKLVRQEMAEVDLKIGITKRKNVKIQDERIDEIMRQNARGFVHDEVGDRLLNRYNELTKMYDRSLEDLQARRAQLMLALLERDGDND